MSSQNHLFRHLRPPKPSKGSTRNGLKNTLKIAAHFFSESMKSVPKREGFFRACRLFFRPFFHFGPKWCLGPPPEGPRTSFDPVFSHFGQPLGGLTPAKPGSDPSKNGQRPQQNRAATSAKPDSDPSKTWPIQWYTSSGEWPGGGISAAAHWIILIHATSSCY